MPTKVITQFVYLGGVESGSEFRLCDINIPSSASELLAPDFSEERFRSYSDAEGELRKVGDTAYSKPTGGGNLWSSFNAPGTTEAGEGVVAVRAVVWESTRIADGIWQPAMPFWIVSLKSRRVLIMAASLEQAEDLHKIARR